MASTNDDAEQNQRYRLGLPEWLHQQVDSGLHKNVCWIDEEEHIFQIPWKHASMNCWENTDASLFKAWAVYTNRYQEGVDEPKHKQWKSNFRCAINSHNRVFFVKEQDRGKVANRRVIRLVGPAGAAKKFESRVPKRKSYKSSRSSKARDESSEDQALNSVEALENCARLLLSLKRSSSICSSGSASSNKSLETDISTTNCSEKRVGIWDNKDDGKERGDYEIPRIKQESINNSDWYTTSAKESPFFVHPVDSPTANEENRKKDIVKPIETKKVDFPFSEEYCLTRLSGKPAEHASSLQKPRGECSTVIAEYSTKQRSLASGENSTGHPFPKPEPDTQMKCSIPTTVIVTINNNFDWQHDRDVSSYRRNSLDDNHAIEKVKGEDEEHNDNIDDDDLIMPRNWR